MARWVACFALVQFLSGASGPVETPFEGVTIESISREEPRPLRIHVVRANLGAPGVAVEVTAGAPQGPGRVATRRVRRAAEEEGYAVAVNGGPFRPIPLADGEPVEIDGPTVHRGTVLAPVRQLRSFLWVAADGRAAIGEGPIPESCREAVPGFDLPACLVDGEVAGPEDTLHPRTGAGVSADGRTLIVVVVDGRQPGRSEGCTLHELARLLREHGARNGIALDGGGSTTLVVADGEGVPRVRNVPVGLRLPGTERPVASALGIRARRRERPSAPSGGAAPEQETDEGAGSSLAGALAWSLLVGGVFVAVTVAGRRRRRAGV